MSDYLISILSNIGMISLLALSAYILLVSGEISFGQQAYFGIGAYISGMVTAMLGWPLWLAILGGCLISGLSALLIGILTLRLSGLYFSIATLCFAEMVRLSLFSIHFQIDIRGEKVGPNGAEGFADIRWIFENDVSPLQFMIIIYLFLSIVLIFLFILERSRTGFIMRMIGQDALLAATQGINVVYFKLLTSLYAGLIAGLGGCLYAHFSTYIEPNIFSVMLGVHSLAYGLIGGLGTALGPVLGVIVDIGFLEGIRVLQGYRMIFFGGLVAIILVFRPRGILDEEQVYRLKRWLQKF